MKRSKKSLTEMTGIIMLGRIVAFSITFFIPIFMVRIFDQEEFGLYKQIFLIAMTLVPILGFNLGQNIFYFFPRGPNNQKAIVLNILLIYLIIGIFSCAFFVFYPSVIASLFKGQKIAVFIPWIGIYLFFLLPSSFFENVAIANGEAKIASMIIVLSDVVRGIFMISAVLIAKNLLIVLLAAIGHSLLRLIILLIYVSKRFKHPYRFEFNLIKRQLLYSLPYGLGDLLFYSRLQIHNFIVAFLFEPRIFAIYSIGVFQLPIINIIRNSIGDILISEFSKLRVKGGKDEIKTIFLSSVRKLSCCLFPIFFFFLTIKKEFIILLFTNNYIDSIPIFAINLATILLAVLIADPVFKNFPKYQFYRLNVTLIFTIILLVALYSFGKKYGVMGVVLINVITLAISQIILFAKSLRIISFSKADTILMIRQNSKSFLVSASSCLPLILLKAFILPINLIALLMIETMLYSVVYICLVYIFNVITDDEKQKISSFLSKKIQKLKLRPIAEPIQKND